MGYDRDPIPEEQGGREPPRRHPPTAVGTATPPPPRPPFRRPWARRRFAPYRSLLGLTVLELVAGATLAAFTANAYLRAVGWTLIGVAVLVSGLFGYALFAAGRVQMWREARWLRRRVKRIGRAPRPAA